MQRTSRRSFTVEIRSGDRRPASAIPKRPSQPVAHVPQIFRTATIAAEPAPKPRRILPSLMEIEGVEAAMLALPELPELQPTRRRVKGGPISGRCGGVKPGQWLSAA